MRLLLYDGRLATGAVSLSPKVLSRGSFIAGQITFQLARYRAVRIACPPNASAQHNGDVDGAKDDGYPAHAAVLHGFWRACRDSQPDPITGGRYRANQTITTHERLIYFVRCPLQMTWPVLLDSSRLNFLRQRNEPFVMNDRRRE